MRRPRDMSSKEHLIMTCFVLGLILVFIGLGGCTQVVHSDQPNWEYPTK